MPHLSHLIPVCLPPSRATLYFRQLASAVGYLHERGITHNDIKPANVLLSHNDIPVLVDFGFAQKWDVGARGSFLSSISWGTPEYLDPQRAKGMPHDERASDVWSLGVSSSFFSISNLGMNWALINSGWGCCRLQCLKSSRVEHPLKQTTKNNSPLPKNSLFIMNVLAKVTGLANGPSHPILKRYCAR